MALSNYGEQFVRSVLKNFYAKAITPVIANTDYEGEIKKFGDTVNVLMFLEEIKMLDYTVGTDMSVEHPVDTEAQLEILQKKYYNFDIDRVDSRFTYVNDEDSTLIQNASKALEKAIDQRLLNRYIEEVGAGNRVGGKHWALVVGDTGTYITITTAASYGIATITGLLHPKSADSDGLGTESAGFPSDIVGKGFRICSSNVNTPWFKVTVRTSSTVIRFVNWDQSAVGSGESGTYVKHVWDGAGLTYGGTCGSGYGCQIEGARATQVTKTNIYALLCDVTTNLDNGDVPQENRHISVPPWFKNMLVQASQLQPDIAMYHSEVVINGKVGRAAGLDVHMVAEDRFSSAVEPINIYGNVSGMTGTKMLANHTSFITFAHAWTESRVVDDIDQFAKLYQGLNLYGFKVMNNRRKAGAYLYGWK